jgi:hypothetical protein
MNINIILLFVAGLVSAGLGSKATFDRGFAARYAEKSPKAWLWRKLLGVERTTFAVHRVFGPLGMVLGVAMIIFGVLLASGKV